MTDWENEIDKKPNPWSIIHEYSKTVITLATGFLAITVTFSGYLLEDIYSPYNVYLLAVCWIFLVLAIICGLLAAVFLSGFLRKKMNPNKCILCSNAAFYLLMSAGVVFLLFGIGQISNYPKNLDATAALKKTLNFTASVYNDVESEWGVESLILDSLTEEWRAVISSLTISKEKIITNKFSVIIDAKQGKIVKFQKIL